MSRKPYRSDLSKYKSVVEKPKIESVEPPKPEKLYTVQIMHPSLRRRTIPSTDGIVLGLITNLGQYDIFEEKDGWGRLKDDSWIML